MPAAHSSTSSLASWPGCSSLIALAVAPLNTSSYLVGSSTGISAGFSPFENAADIKDATATAVGIAGPVAHQTAGLDELAQIETRRQCMAGRQRNGRSTPAVEKRPSADEQHGGARLDDGGEGAIDFAFVSGFYNQNLPTERPRRRVKLSKRGLSEVCSTRR